MTEIRYVNSAGTEVDLLGAKLRIQDGNLHKREWELKTTALKRGVKIESYNKKAIVYPLVTELRGSVEERKQRLDELNDIFEYDIAREELGTLYFGESYIKGIVISSDAHVSENVGRTELELDIYCPYPFWIKEEKRSLAPIGADETGVQTVYPKEYPYRYSFTAKNQKINIDHFTDSNFQMVIHGPTEKVDVTIGDHPYRVNHVIAAGEYMVIDSRQNLDPDKRCYIVHANGKMENVYNDRDSEYSIFQKIPPGTVYIYYSRAYGIDLTVYVERGEPKWI